MFEWSPLALLSAQTRCFGRVLKRTNAPTPVLRYIGSLPRSIGMDIALPLPQNPAEDLLGLLPPGRINEFHSDLTRLPNWAGEAAAGRSYYSIIAYPFRPHVFRRGAGWFGGRHTQPGSARTPTPAFGSGKQIAEELHPLGDGNQPQAGDAGPSPHQARPSNRSESPKAIGTVLGW